MPGISRCRKLTLRPIWRTQPVTAMFRDGTLTPGPGCWSGETATRALTRLYQGTCGPANRLDKPESSCLRHNALFGAQCLNQDGLRTKMLERATEASKVQGLPFSLGKKRGITSIQQNRCVKTASILEQRISQSVVTYTYTRKPLTQQRWDHDKERLDLGL